MYVALLNDGEIEADLRLPITQFLVESQGTVLSCPPRVRDRAQALMREAWAAVAATSLWSAAVRCMEARSVARENPTIGQQEIEGLDLCRAFRDVYPKAPRNFEKVGRTAKQEE